MRDWQRPIRLSKVQTCLFHPIDEARFLTVTELPKIVLYWGRIATTEILQSDSRSLLGLAVPRAVRRTYGTLVGLL